MLNHWKLKDFKPGEGVKLGAFSSQFDESDWMDVSAPGDVHTALIAAGRIPDPFYNRNEIDCFWMENREWWYRTQFIQEVDLSSSQQRLLLVFLGLDTFVTIWLNGELLGNHNNMFREAVFDITNKIHADQANTLALCFEPPLDHVRQMPALYWEPGNLQESKRNLMRKAQFGYGWDWGPRLPTVGIWRPVELHHQYQATIRGVQFSTIEIDPNKQQALVSVKAEVERFAGGEPIQVVFKLITPDGGKRGIEKSLVLKGGGDHLEAETSMVVEQPSLWWTHDLGEPYLYAFQVIVLQDGKELDRKEMPVGIRTLVLDQSHDPEEPGTHFFRFVLNGIPIFARGANWIPASSFVGALTRDRYEHLLTSTRDANMNMLRVWGGGIYEHEVFYELCDRLGILIWQDFMFACAPYPEDDLEFVHEVKSEVRYQVKRLRNHPCLALWCGNNENQWLHQRRASEQEKGLPVPGTLYYDEIMPSEVQDLDGSTPYWPGSPYGGSQPNSVLKGDVHDWHVWHGVPVKEMDDSDLDELHLSGPKPEDVSFVHYAENMGRFISEFGMHASPVYETLRRCIPSDQLYHHSPAMDHHNKDNPKDKGDNLMLTVTGLSQDLEEYIDFSMIAQAEGLKFGIEHFRRRKPHCSGTLLWQLNDCWPGLSWSILDYYGYGKAGYYYVKRAYAPVLASFKALEDGRVELWITNDTLENVKDTIAIQMDTFAEGMEWEERLHVEVGANRSQMMWRGEQQQIIAKPDHYLAVHSLSNCFPSNRHFFAAVKDLQRPVVRPEISLSSLGEDEVLVHLYAPAYLYYVHVIVPDEHTHFSDNYFDLMAGESRTIEVTNQKITLTPDLITVKWR